MRNLFHTVLIALTLASFSGCNAKDPTQPKPPTPQTDGVIPQAQLDALNKAKNVEQVLQQEADKRGRTGRSITMTAVESFSYIAGADCHTLILGTMPGTVSLAHQQYYAHPRNAFWRIVADIFGIDPNADYAQRTAQLAAHNIALWDVLQSCIRKGSLDASIDATSIVPNDIAEFIDKHRAIRRICFNGGTAAKLFNRHIKPNLRTHLSIEYLPLPSTSPAHAGMPYTEKLLRWRMALAN